MKKRIIFGMIFLILGLVVFLIASFYGLTVFYISSVYALPLIIIGIFIIFNKREDEIEQINYFKLERRKK